MIWSEEKLARLRDVMAQTGSMANCWWCDPETQKFLAEAAEVGLVRKPSLTQVEWTERGVYEAFFASDLVADEDVREAAARIYRNRDELCRRSFREVGHRAELEHFDDAIRVLLDATPFSEAGMIRFDAFLEAGQRWDMGLDARPVIPGGPAAGIKRLAGYFQRLEREGDEAGLNGTLGMQTTIIGKRRGLLDLVRLLIGESDAGQEAWVDAAGMAAITKT